MKIMRAIKSLSISTSAVFISILGVVLVLVPVLTILLFLLGSQNREIADRRWREITTSIFVLAESYVERYDYAAVVELVETLHREGTSSYMNVSDPGGINIAKIGQIPNGRQEALTTYNSNILSFSILRPQTAESAISKSFLVLFISVPAVSIIFLSFLQFLFFKRILVNPLKRMSEEVAEFRDEKWSNIDADFGKEVMQLTTGLNEMAERVISRKQILEQQNQRVLDQIEIIRNTQEELVQARRLDAIGQLAAGFAHDFNNILGVVVGNMDIAGLDLKKYSKARGETDPDLENISFRIQTAMDAAMRGSALTQRMLGFARRARIDPSVTEINNLVKDTVALAIKSIPANIAINLDLSAEQTPAFVDRGQIENVLLNLIINARDAMPEGGTLDLKSEHRKLTASDHILEPGDYIVVSVSDTGKGMDDQTQTKIFDPFFTTKKDHGGTGLGLSMAREVMNESKGTITVESALNKGATFSLYFPLIETNGNETLPVVSASSETGSLAKTSLKILLVDDNEDLLTVTCENLIRMGHIVSTAYNSDIALATFDENPEFDVLITDVVMPGHMQGPDLANAIKSKRPDIGLIFISGYADEVKEQAIQRHPGAIHLTKPIHRNDLLIALDAYLDRQ